MPTPGALIPVDGEPIRKRARKAYAKARRDLDHARAQLNQFHTQDRPAFERWLHTHFGPQPTELRALGRHVCEQQQLITEVENYQWGHDVSAAQTYTAVQQRRAGVVEPAQEPPPEAGPKATADFADEDAAFDGRSEEEAFNEFTRAFEEFFGQKLPPGLRPPAPPAKPPATARVKELHRTLVRKLHPDKQAAMTAQKLEWWHEVQAAYADADAERLATILSLIEVSEGDPAAHTDVATFQRLAVRLKANLRELKQELTQHRRHPGWRFQELPGRNALASQVSQDLDSELHQLKVIMAENAALLRTWGDQACGQNGRRPRSGTQSKHRGPPEHTGFDF